jgi:hypothetical protein
MSEDCHLCKRSIEGIPVKAGLYRLKISAASNNENAYKNVEKIINLVVTTP